MSMVNEHSWDSFIRNTRDTKMMFGRTSTHRKLSVFSNQVLALWRTSREPSLGMMRTNPASRQLAIKVAKVHPNQH